MTVKQLIEQLNRMDQSANVYYKKGKNLHSVQMVVKRPLGVALTNEEDCR